MKSRKIINLFTILFCVGFLASCGTKNASSEQPSSHDHPSSSEPSQPAHVHSYVNKVATEQYLASAADCTHPAKYYYSCDCGQAWTETFESGEALGHSWHQEVSAQYLASAATCQSRAFYYLSCERCGAASTETFGVGECTAHKFTKVVISNETLKSAATCTAPAYYYYSCEDCGEIDHEHSVSVGDPLGHVWDEVADSTHLVNAATCLDKAIYHVSCTRCHADHPTMTFEYGDPLGHEFTAYVSNSDATCTHNGTETAHCNHPGCTATDTREVANSMLAHSLVNEVAPQYLKSAATCLEDAVYHKHCENCDHIDEETFVDTGSVLGHEFNPITGHCIHSGCEETTAVQINASYGDGTFACVEANDEALLRDIPMNGKAIYDIAFSGDEPTTNFYFMPRKVGSSVYFTNLEVVAFDEDGNSVPYRRVQASRSMFIFDVSFAQGSHLYIHVTAKGTWHDNFFIEYATHQFTNLTYVGRKPATCVTPLIYTHFTFDQSDALNLWLNDVATRVYPISDFYAGEAGSGHNLTHYNATVATATSPSLKEHWFCEKCGCYFLDPNVDEECAYEDLYSDLFYGTVRSYYLVTGRGVVLRWLIKVDNGESPIETNDARYINQSPQRTLTAHVIRADNTVSDYTVTGITVNNHIGDFLLRGADVDDFDANNPVAVYFTLYAAG